MSGLRSLVAESAALVATTVAIVAAVPQLRRVIVGRDCRGVSVTSAALGIGTELTWIVYASSSGLWSALPEAVSMACANVTLVVALVRRGAVARAALPAGVAWLAMFAAVGAVGGVRVLATVLGTAYVVQVAPAVWTAWTTASPSGVAAATWVMIATEGLLWGVYGLHHADPATSCFAVVAVLAAGAMLSRTATVGRRSRVLAHRPPAVPWVLLVAGSPGATSSTTRSRSGRGEVG